MLQRLHISIMPKNNATCRKNEERISLKYKEGQHIFVFIKNQNDFFDKLVNGTFNITPAPFEIVICDGGAYKGLPRCNLTCECVKDHIKRLFPNAEYTKCIGCL